MTLPVVLCTLPLHPAGAALLTPHAEIRLAPDTSAATICAAVGDADLLLVRTQLPPDLFERPNRLLGVVRNGTGLDLIPVASATQHCIPVANVPGANVQTVAEYCIAAMLAFWAAAVTGASGLALTRFRFISKVMDCPPKSNAPCPLIVSPVSVRL